MADLTEVQSSQAVKIAGANPSTGIEDSFAEVDTDGNLNVISILRGLPGFQCSQQTVGTSAVQLAVTSLTNRSCISLKVKTSHSNDIVYINNSNSVSASNGYALFNGESINLDLTPASSIWAISNASGQKVYIMEIGG